MPLTTDMRVIWTGTHAGIPANFSRDTNFDDRYIQGSDDPSNYTGPTNGGSSNHDHDIENHGHDGLSHNHTLSSNIIVGSAASYENIGGATIIPRRKHQHASTNSNNSEVEYNDNTQNLATSTVHPQYVTMIVLEPDDNLQEIPDDAIAFIDNGDIPSGYVLADGNEGIGYFSLVNMILRTATTGSDGFTYGGTTNHVHAASGGHTHTSNNHIHSSISGTTGTLLGLPPVRFPASGSSAIVSHHAVILLGASTPTTNSTSVAANSYSNLPKVRSLLGIRNTSGSASTPDNIIILYVGDVTAGLPEGWVLCDGSNFTPDMTDQQVIIVTDPMLIGIAAGDNDHVHDTIAHSHSIFGGSHNHSYSEIDITTNIILENGPRSSLHPTVTHTHTWTIGNSDITPTQTSTPNTTSADKRYLYRNVVFIKKSPGITVHIDGSTQIDGLTSIAAL